MTVLLAAALVVGGSVALALALLWIFHDRVPAMLDPADNETAGFVYALMGVIYGITLAFVVFAVWERFNAASEAATEEAAMVVSIYRDTETFPPAVRDEARAELRAYVEGVTESEWTTHPGAAAHATPDRLNRAFEIWRDARPLGPESQAEHHAAMERLHTLEGQRHLRHLAVESTLPGIFWPILIVGAFITVVFSFVFRMRRRWAQALVTAAVTSLIAGALFLIMSLNRPFTGLEKVSSEPFDHALRQFDAIDLRPAGAP